MSEPVLEVKNLVKTFRSVHAVDNISFTVPRGKIIGLLGPNGAGKSTTIRMLLGITLHDAGTITYFGEDFSTHRQASLQRINFTSSYNTLQGKISVWENLLVFAGLYSEAHPEPIIRELLEYFEIGHLIHQPVWDLSDGERTRVNLIKMMLNKPELILMDEPTASLDPDIADKTLSFIEELRLKKNISVLYTSHNMPEITRICDEVIFLDEGKIVAHDTPRNLTKRITKVQLTLRYEGSQTTLASYLKKAGLTHVFDQDGSVTIDTNESKIPEIILEIAKAKLRVTDIEITKPTLEDVFLQIARGDTYVS